MKGREGPRADGGYPTAVGGGNGHAERAAGLEPRLRGRVGSSIPMPLGRCLQQPVQLVPGLVVPGVKDPLQLAQVARRDRAPSEQEPGVPGSLVQQLAQLPEGTGCVGEVGQPVQSGLVALVRQLAQGLPIDIMCAMTPCCNPALREGSSGTTAE